MTSIAELQFKKLSLQTGVRLHCAEMGPRDGTPILFLHGCSDSWFSFSRIVGLLPPELRLVIPDQRGHGESEYPPGGYGPPKLAADAIALLDNLGIASAVVVGHSLGSFVAQWMAALAPNRVRKLVLVGSAARTDNHVVRGLAQTVQSLRDPVDAAFIREFQESTIHRPVPPQFLEIVIAESMKLPARVWKAVAAGLLNVPVPHAAAIRCPVSLLWGSHDAIFSRSDQDELTRRIPGAKLQVLADVGHAPHWEAPEDFVAHLLRN